MRIPHPPDTFSRFRLPCATALFVFLVSCLAGGGGLNVASAAETARTDSSSAAPGFTPLRVAEYPLSPGMVWRYRTEETLPNGEGIESRTGLLEVKALARHRHGSLNVTVLARQRSGPEPSEDIAFVVESDSAAWFISDPRRMRAIFAGDRDALDPERADLRLPLVPGRKWGVLESRERPDSRYVWTVGAPEAIVVPAGSFECLPVRFSTLPDESTTWYRAGTGLVQYVYRHPGNRVMESWRLIEFRRGPVDSAAVGRAIDGAFDRLLAQPGFWSRRSSAVWDPTLRALLGPLSGGDGADLDEGIRRFNIRGNGSGLSVEQVSNVPSWAYLVRWRSDLGVHHVYAREWEPISGGTLGPDPAPPLFLDSVSKTAPGKVLQSVRAGFLRARDAADRGDRVRAGLAADSAMAMAADALAAILDRAPADAGVTGVKELVSEAIGDAFLVTHYGSRIRIDDGYVRYRLERESGLNGVSADIVSDGRTRYGPAPRVRLAGGPETWVPGGGAPTMDPRRVLDLDWSRETPEPDLLLWSAGLPPAVQPSILLYRLERGGEARPLWKKELLDGRARIDGDGGRLELNYALRDSLNGLFRTRWRETYDPPTVGDPGPAPVRREILNPWVATTARVVHALRAGRRDLAAPVVRGAELLGRLEGSWLADAGVVIQSAAADPESIDELHGDRVASVFLKRGPKRLPENPGPEGLVMRLSPDANGIWVVIDLVARYPQDFINR